MSSAQLEAPSNGIEINAENSRFHTDWPLSRVVYHSYFWNVVTNADSYRALFKTTTTTLGYHELELELELELYFYLNTVNLSDKITIKITIYLNLYKHGLKTYM